MNPTAGETFAATLLAFLLSGAQFVQETFHLEWPGWTLRDGAVISGEMRDFDWATKSLILNREGGESPVRVAAEDLEFWSKVRMLGSAPFHDRLASQLADLEQMPGFRSGVDRLQRIGVVLVSAYVFLFSTLNLLLAGWILRNGSILRWLESGAAFVVLTALSAGLVVVCMDQFGSHQLLEYVGLAVFLHTVLFVVLIWAIYRAGPWRSAIWYVMCCLVALCLPVTLVGTVFSAQVHRFTGALDLAAWDRYLTEIWLRPMGLL